MRNRHGCKGAEQSNSGAASASETGLWKLKFNTYYSHKWHAGLYRFWRFWEDVAAIVPVFLSLSIVGVVLEKVGSEFSLVLAALSTVLSLFSLAKGFGDKAAFYRMQSKRYLSLFSRIERPGAIDELDSLWDKFDEIEKDDREEGLDNYGINCYNKTAVKLGVPDSCIPLSWFKKITMCFF